MSKYSCETCNFQTDSSSNWCKHKKTNKHLNNNLLNICICKYCNSTFGTPTLLVEHFQNGCSSLFTTNQVDVLQQELIKLRDTVTELSRKLEEVNDDRVNILKNTVTTLQEDKQDLRTNLADTTNAMKFLTRNFKTTEPLKCITEDKAHEMLTFDKSVYIDNETNFKHLSKTQMSDKLNDLCVEQMIYEQNNRKLHCYLTKIVKNEYTESNPTKQKIWNTDKSRLSYIIREAINKKSEWIRDDKGHKIKEYVVSPILTTAQSMIVTYTEKLNEMIKKDKYPVGYDRCIAMERLATSSNIVKNIRNKTLEDKILFEMCSYFGISNVKKITDIDDNSNTKKGVNNDNDYYDDENNDDNMD
jgi:hypothetical protein